MSNTIKAVLVDDENIHHDILKRNLALSCPGVKLVAELYSGQESLAKLPGLDFDLLLLDIELGDMNSFEMLQKLPMNDLHVIFITSFDKYAMQAFKVHAVDYLLKPVDGIELRSAIERAMSQIINRERRNNLVSDYSLDKNNKLMVSYSNDIYLIGIESVLYCSSDGNYTDIHQMNSDGKEKRYTDSHNLKYYEEKLRSFGFIRIHQSYLVNREHVTRIRRNPPELIMTNEVALPIARDRKQDVIDLLGG